MESLTETPSNNNNKQPDPPKGGKQRGEMELERQTSEQGNDAVKNDSQTDKCGTWLR